jgi:hypothetical protein
VLFPASMRRAELSRSQTRGDDAISINGRAKG